MRARFPSRLGPVFGLGTVLLLGPALCCVLIGCGTQTSPEVAEAIAVVERLGGTIKHDERRAGRPVVEVSLGGTRVGDGDLARLACFTELDTVSCHESAVGDAGLANLKACAKLQTLYLGRTQVTDDGLANLAGLKQLKTLGLIDTRVTDAGLAHLRGLANLKSINLHGARVTPEGIRQLEEALPGLVVHR